MSLDEPLRTAKMPRHLELELAALGVLATEEPTPIVERDFTFKMPELDENGEPPW